MYRRIILSLILPFCLLVVLFSVIAETAVNGQWAIWLEWPHQFRLADGRWQEWQFIESNVLIWWAREGLTFRLEGADSLTEAVRIAESLHKYEE